MGPNRHVLARDPFRVEQREGTRVGRHLHLHVKEAARCVGRIHFQRDRRILRKTAGEKQRQ